MRDPTPRVRPATSDDLPFVLGLVPRLVVLELPPGRDRAAVRATSERLLRSGVEAFDPAAGVVLVAESDGGEPLGVVQLERDTDFFSDEPQGYVANLAVAEAAEGRGVGRALLRAAEAWARERGLRHLTLYVFAGNAPARAFYRALGFVEDSLKLVKRADG